MQYLREPNQAMTSPGSLRRVAAEIRSGFTMLNSDAWAIDTAADLIDRLVAEVKQLTESITATHARRTDPGTSHAAAASVTGKTETHAEILEILEHHGRLSDTQIADYAARRSNVQVSPSGLRSRRAELVRLGKVRAHGLVRLESGRLSQTWGLM